jgi:hypothetical protein
MLRCSSGIQRLQAEYLSKDPENFLKEEGIPRQLSVEYTPQQNGVAVEMTRCMMLQGNLPDSLWAEAVNTATYLRKKVCNKMSQRNHTD